MYKLKHTLRTRLTALLLALVCMLSAFPTEVFAAKPNTIKLEKFGYYGANYQSAKLGNCLIHQMFVRFVP